jgi:hypothetical protein
MAGRLERTNLPHSRVREDLIVMLSSLSRPRIVRGELSRDLLTSHSSGEVTLGDF